MTKHLHALPLTLLFSRIGIALMVVPILALTLYGQAIATSAQAAQIQANSSAVTNATDAQVINDVPDVTQNPLFYAMHNGVQLRNKDIHQHLRRSIK